MCLVHLLQIKPRFARVPNTALNSGPGFKKPHQREAPGGTAQRLRQAFAGHLGWAELAACFARRWCAHAQIATCSAMPQFFGQEWAALLRLAFFQ